MNEINQEHPIAPDEKPSYYVGLGASAGGLEALQIFFDNMPHESGLAFIVVQHLSPDYKSLMVELLSKHTKMEVLRVEDSVTIRRNKVYLIPPKKNMAIQSGNLYLTEQTQRHGLNLPIDFFFRSLAEDQGECAIGIILSGTGSDGTRGVRAIKEEGGTVIVQSEESAKFDGMPRSAIATGVADFILPPEVIPAELLKFINHPYIAEKKEPEDTIVEEESTFSKIFRIINKKTNADFSHYKPSTMVRRIERRMGIVQVNCLDDYLEYLHRNPKEVLLLFKDLLIGVTKFFRDTESFRIIKDQVIPKLFENARIRDNRTVRVWIAGCSTGEEAYSIAMMLQDYMDIHKIAFDVKVFATDIDREAIEFASIGLYSESIVADVDIEFLSRNFEKRANGYQVRRSIREMVVFAVQNLVKDPPFTKVDLITCRNLLIYLKPVLQKQVLSIFNYALVPNGFLFLGSSETVGDMNHEFETFDSKHRIFRHPNKGSVPVRGEGNIPIPFGRNKIPVNQQFIQLPEPDISLKQIETREQYYHSLIRTLASAVIVINSDREVFQTFGDTRSYLEMPQGNVTLDVLLMLPRELSLAASSAIHNVRKTGKSVTYHDIRIGKDNEARFVNLKADMIREIKGRSQIFVLIIEPAGILPISRESAIRSDDFTEQRINDLEQEIQFTRENLQATIEELQTSNEELQATNEELLAANEELQSTNEELQSVNEELNTVNSEYQTKNMELTELNTDIRNLMESTDIGTIFLDKHLRIRKFTPAIQRTINILDQDIGRPLSDLSLPALGDVLSDVRTVMKTSERIERQVRVHERTFLFRMLPFINEKNEFDGVVLTLIDITAQADAENELRLRNKLLEDILEKSPSAQLMVDEGGKILFVNERAGALLGIEKEALLAKPDMSSLKFTDLDGNPVTLQNGPLSMIKDTGKELDKYIMCLHTASRGEIIFSLSGNPVPVKDNRIGGAIFKLEKLAHRTHQEE